MNAEPGTPLNDLLTSIDRLTKPIADPVWQDTLDADLLAKGRVKVTGRELVTVNRDSLIGQLRAAIRSSLSTPADTIRGGGAQMGGLNVTALMMYEEISERVISAWHDLTGQRSKELPEIVLRHWYMHARNLHESGQWSEQQIRAWTSITSGWVRQIEAMFDPETIKELAGPCPNCESARFFDKKESVEKSALFIHFKDDIEPEAVCRACGWTETGPRRLLELGYHLGATVDEETLKDMGVIV